MESDGGLYLPEGGYPPELEEEDAEPRFRCRGDIQQLYYWLDHPEEAPSEVVFEGVPGSAKTRNILEWIHVALERYPGTPTLFLRETRSSLADSVLPIWEEEVLGLEHPAIQGATREYRKKYRHLDTGWEVSLGGYDKPTKVFSTQWGILYFNEMQESTLIKWVQLARSRRARGQRRDAREGRDDRLPFRILLGDCNPEYENHWINRRACAGGFHTAAECPSQMHRLIGRFWDNPLYYDATKEEWTPEGDDFVSGLRTSTTGTVFEQRHVEGKWVSAQGQVWGTYDKQASDISGQVREDENGFIYLWVRDWKQRIYFDYFLGGHDWGFDEPACLQLWGVDSDRRAYRLVEAYAPGLSDDQWAEMFWKPIWEKFKPIAILTDWNGALRTSIRTQIDLAFETDEDEDRVVQAWSKARDPRGEKTGIDVVRRRFRPRGDGTRGVYFLKEAHLFTPNNPLKSAETHPSYLEAVQRRGKFERFGLPLSTEEEINAWIYPPLEERKNREEPIPDPKCADHGCDTMRGTLNWIEYREIEPETQPKYARDSYGAVLGHDEVFGDDEDE